MKANVNISKQLLGPVLMGAYSYSSIGRHMNSHGVGYMSLLTSRILWLNLPFELYPLILGGCHLDHLVKEPCKETTFSMNKRKGICQKVIAL